MSKTTKPQKLKLSSWIITKTTQQVKLNWLRFPINTGNRCTQNGSKSSHWSMCASKKVQIYFCCMLKHTHPPMMRIHCFGRHQKQSILTDSSNQLKNAPVFIRLCIHNSSFPTKEKNYGRKFQSMMKWNKGIKTIYIPRSDFS